MRVHKILAKDFWLYKKRLIEYKSNIDRESIFEEQRTFYLAMEQEEILEASLKNGRTIIFVAVESEEIIGLVWAYDKPFRDDKNRIYINILHVQPSFRGKGIGQRLLDSIEEDAKAWGYSAIYLHLWAAEQNSFMFYEKKGYQRERIQVVKKINDLDSLEIQGKVEEDRFQIGYIQKVDEGFIHANLPELSRIYKEHVHAHILTKSFSYSDAVEVMKKLASYLKNDMAYTYCYFVDNVIIGIVWVYQYTFKGENRLYIREIQVKTDYRGMKIGHKLYREVVKQMRLLGVKTLSTCVDAANTGSLGFHWNQGFKDEIYQMVKVCDKYLEEI